MYFPIIFHALTFDWNQLTSLFFFFLTYFEGIPIWSQILLRGVQNGRQYYEFSCGWSHFMVNNFSVDKEGLLQAFIWFLQPSCFNDSCNFSCDIGLSHYSRLEVPSLSLGFKIFHKAGILSNVFVVPLFMGLFSLKSFGTFHTLVTLCLRSWTNSKKGILLESLV